jgi:hypothetical protein
MPPLSVERLTHWFGVEDMLKATKDHIFGENAVKEGKIEDFAAKTPFLHS